MRRGEMKGLKRAPIKVETLEAASEIAHLNLSAERAAWIESTVDAIFELLDSLDKLELGETSPAFGFNPRWEE